MDTLTALKEHGPWLAMSELVKLTGQDAPTLRAELKEKLEASLVQKIGQKRGTRYGLPDAEPPESKDNVDFKVEIINVMEEIKDRVSRKTLCEKIGTYDAKIRPSLLALVDEGIVWDNGKKKGQLFWLAAHEEDGLIEPEPEPEPKKPTKPEPVAEEDKPEIKNSEELVRMGLSSLPLGPNCALTIDDLKSHISSVAKHSFGSGDIFKAFYKLFKSGKLPRLKHEMRNENGQRMFFWVEAIQ